MRNGNFLKMCVNEIGVKQIRVNQVLGVVVTITPLRYKDSVLQLKSRYPLM